MRRGAVLSIALVGVLLSAPAAWAAGRLAWQLRPTVEQPADLVLAATSAVLALLLTRLAACALLVTAALAAPRARATRRCAAALSPGLLRPLVVAALGVGLGLAGATMASAAPGSGAGRAPSVAVGWTADRGSSRTPDTSTVAPAVAPSVAAGWVAVAPATPSTAGADVHLVSSGRASARSTDDLVVARRGDCLWTLAARQLGDRASDVEVTAQWHRWWAVNRAAIGDDPDLLLPGTRLVVPSTAGALQ